MALVTGAGTGLGRAIAKTLAKEGFTVAITGRREEKLRKVEKEIESDRVIVLTADITEEQNVAQLRDDLLEQTGGKLNLLVNNVGGVPAMASIEVKTVAEEEKENGIEVHLFDPENVVSEANPEGEKYPMKMMGKLPGNCKLNHYGLKVHRFVNLTKVSSA